eukprot:1185950-Prorocentrum_minimum.AAC.3
MDTCSSPGGQCTSTSSSADVGNAAPSGGGPSIDATRPPEANAGMPCHQATVTVTTTLMSRFKQEIMQWRGVFINDNRRIWLKTLNICRPPCHIYRY